MKESDLIYGLMRSFNKTEYCFEDLLWLTDPFHISETCLRSNLSRMAKSGIIRIRKEGRKAFYFFTRKGDNLGTNVASAFHSPDWSGWTEDWWGISVSVPDGERAMRYKIYKKLSFYRFAPLHPGFWIRPFRVQERIEHALKSVLSAPYCKVVRFRFHDSRELKQIPSIWKLKEINSRFRDCLQYISKSYDEYDLENPKEALRGKMILGGIMVKQLASDPLLPACFLPADWHGDELRQTFRNWMKLTTAKSRPYWESIFTQSDTPYTNSEKHEIEYYMVIR